MFSVIMVFVLAACDSTIEQSEILSQLEVTFEPTLEPSHIQKAENTPLVDVDIKEPEIINQHPSTINPYNYWISDSEFDVLGFMEAYGCIVDTRGVYAKSEFSSSGLFWALNWSRRGGGFWYLDSSGIIVSKPNQKISYSSLFPEIEKEENLIIAFWLDGEDFYINKDLLEVFIVIVPRVFDPMIEDPFEGIVGEYRADEWVD